MLIIAHGASFDRPFSEKLFPSLRRSTGPARTPRSTGNRAATGGPNSPTCSTTSGCSTRGTGRWTIATLSLAVLSSVLPPATRPPLGALLKNARKASVRIWAEEAPFDHKDTLRARGYRWSNGTDGTPKAWWKDVDEATAEAELAYLRTEIYKNADLELPLSGSPASIASRRGRSRAGTTGSFGQHVQFVLDQD